MAVFRSTLSYLFISETILFCNGNSEFGWLVSSVKSYLALPNHITVRATINYQLVNVNSPVTCNSNYNSIYFFKKLFFQACPLR